MIAIRVLPRPNDPRGPISGEASPQGLRHELTIDEGYDVGFGDLPMPQRVIQPIVWSFYSVAHYW